MAMDISSVIVGLYESAVKILSATNNNIIFLRLDELHIPFAARPSIGTEHVNFHVPLAANNERDSSKCNFRFTPRCLIDDGESPSEEVCS